MAEQVRGDIAQKTTSLVDTKSSSLVNGTAHPSLSSHGHFKNSHSVKPRSSIQNGTTTNGKKPNGKTKKIRLIIPRKRKIDQIESAKSISSDSKQFTSSNAPKMTINGLEPPTKKQKLSPTQQQQHQPLNENKVATNHCTKAPKPKPQPRKPSIVSSSLPPPPPLQNLSPPPPFVSQPIPRYDPYRYLQNQLKLKNLSKIAIEKQHQRTKNHEKSTTTYYYPKKEKKIVEKKEEEPKKEKVKKKKSDKHNQRDKDGNYPRFDANGKKYAFFCDTCGKGFDVQSSLNGHRSVHKRMEKMGKYYNKQSGKHEFKIDIERKEKVKTNKDEYANLSKIEIMSKIMDKLEQMDEDKLFFSIDTSKEFVDQIDESLSFEILRKRILNDKYRSIQQFKADLNKLFRSVFRVYNESHIRWKCALKLKQFAYKQIMTAIQPTIHPNLRKKQPQKQSTKQQFQPSNLSIIETDGYVEISDYEFFCDDDVLKEKMKCAKKVNCNGKCCSTFEELGPYSIHTEEWKSACLCRSKSMECTDECGCDPLQCKNRGIRQRKDKKMNECVREQEVFGIDQHTRNCLERALPKEIFTKVFTESDNIKEAKSYFIEKMVLPSINNYNFFVAEHAKYKSKYDPNLMVKSQESEAEFMITDVFRSMMFLYASKPLILRILSYLIRLILDMGHSELTHDTSSIEASKRRIKFDDDIIDFLSLYERSDLDVTGEDIICHVHFPIYSKGLGVVCTSLDGIASNEYIISFLGVVFQPWSWYEKDDRTRWLIKRQNAPKAAEFFNIMLERHKDDPNGYDLVFVDPHFRGNYGSRLSHSCSPNCISVTMGVSEKYRIAVYASQKIEYGEELCFDYNSVTESEQEWRAAVCLCGRSKCRGQFLIYAGTTLYTEVVREHYGTLHRMADLFNCCVDVSNGNENENDDWWKCILDKYCLKESVLSGIPMFIQKYAAKICKFIDFEQSELPKVLFEKAQKNEKGYEQFKDIENAKEECKGLQYVRLSNLVITLNKINLFYRQPVNANLMKMSLFKRCTAKDLIERIWFAQHSIIRDLSLFIAIHCGQSHKILQMIAKYQKDLIKVKTKISVKNVNGTDDMSISSKYLMNLRRELLKLSATNCAYHHAAADVLLWWASTKYFFEFCPPLQGFQSRQFSYAELGYFDSSNESNCHPPAKKYNSQYVWGQCAFWERHTIESPDSSLSADRRGTICLPNIKCCYAANTMTKIKKTYSYQQRKAVIKHIETKNQCSWSSRWHFSFKNGAIYGSPWLDSYIDEAEKEKLANLIQTMKDAQVCYPDGTLTAILDDDEKDESVVMVVEKEEKKKEKEQSEKMEVDVEENEKKEEKEDENNKRRSVRLRGKERKNYLDPHVPAYWKKKNKK